MMKLILLPRSKIELGLPLLWSVRDQHGKLLLAIGNSIDTARQLDQLLEIGAYVDKSEILASSKILLRDSTLPDGAVSLMSLWGQAPDCLQILLTCPERKTDFSAQVAAFATHVVELHDTNPDFSIYRAVRQEHYKVSNYGHAHCVHTATLCILLARQLHWTPRRLMSLVKAALTMNMTILGLQSRMAIQNDPLSAAQRAEILGHPQQSVALLEKLGVTDADWLGAVAQHHEHQDGSGYPAGCTEIDEMANVLHVCDVFMAKISPRVLRPALSPQEAIRQLYREDQGGPIATALIKTFGIYPPGDFVQLASGELGIVVERTANAKAPIVASITNDKGASVTSTLRRDTRQAAFAVVGAASDKTMLARLLPERLYGFSIALPLREPFADFLVD
jgi:HD-GYP domain-containing protein (c-di-GMP phosphodiesterase class II)